MQAARARAAFRIHVSDVPGDRCNLEPLGSSRGDGAEAGHAGVKMEKGSSLLRNSRKTECGANMFLTRLVVRAAPFARLSSRCSRWGLTRMGFQNRVQTVICPLTFQALMPV